MTTGRHRQRSAQALTKLGAQLAERLVQRCHILAPRPVGVAVEGHGNRRASLESASLVQAVPNRRLSGRNAAWTLVTSSRAPAPIELDTQPSLVLDAAVLGKGPAGTPGEATFVPYRARQTASNATASATTPSMEYQC